MKIRTIIGIAAVVVLGLVAAAVIYLMSIDVNQYRGLIAEKATSITGRKLTLAGPISLALGLSPAVVINDARLANAPWGTRADMIRLKRIEVEIKLIPLIFGDIRVKRLILIEPDIWLETDKKGRGNWELDSGKPKKDKKDDSPSSGAVAIPLIADLRLRDAKLAFRDGKSGEKFTVSLKKVEARASGFDAPLQFELAGSWNKVAFSADGQIGSLSSLTKAAPPYPVKLDAKVAGVDLRVEGTVTNPLQVKQVALKIAADAKTLGGLKPIAGEAVAGMGPVSFRAEVAGDLSRIQLKALKFSIGKSDLKGRIEARLAGAKPHLSVNLRSNRIDLNDLNPEQENDSPAKGKSASPKKGSGKIFSKDPLPLDSLKKVDVNLQFSGKEILAKGLILRGVKIRLALKDGRLSVKPFEGQLGGGEFKGAVTLDARRKVPALSINLKAKKFDLGRILKEADVKDLYEGKGDLAIDLKGRGRSVASIMGSLNGETRLVLGKGRLKSKALDFALGGFSKVMGTLTSGSGEYSTVNCVINKFAISNGIAKSKIMLADTQYSTVVGEGNIHLGQETLNLKVTPKAKSATLNVAFPVNIRGTLANPSFRPDELGVAKKIGGLVALFVFPPAAVVGLGEMGTGDEGGECLKIAQGKGTAQTPTTSKPSTGEALMKSVEGGVKELGEGLKKLFGQ